MGYEQHRAQKKHFWLFIILMIIAVLLIPLGLDKLGDKMAEDEESIYIYESLGTLSMITLCVLILVVFYLINTIAKYRFQKRLPKDYWSAWGITKKVAGTIGVILCFVLFAVNLSNVLVDLEKEPVYDTIIISEQAPTVINNRVSLYYYDDETYDAQNSANNVAKYRGNIYVKSGVKISAGKTYKVRIYESGNFWVAVDEITNG